MNYKKVAIEIIEAIDGGENVESLTHCATRLRFKLKTTDASFAEKVKALDGVINVVESGGQFQVIIGNEVSSVFKEANNVLGVQEGETPSNAKSQKEKLKVKGKFVDKVIDLVTNIFTPILPVLIGAGMIRAL